jgi:hypothetical protein
MAGRGSLAAPSRADHHGERPVAGVHGSQGTLVGQAQVGRLGGCVVRQWPCPLAPCPSTVGEAPRQHPRLGTTAVGEVGTCGGRAHTRGWPNLIGRTHTGDDGSANGKHDWLLSASDSTGLTWWQPMSAQAGGADWGERGLMCGASLRGSHWRLGLAAVHSPCGGDAAWLTDGAQPGKRNLIFFVPFPMNAEVEIKSGKK